MSSPSQHGQPLRVRRTPRIRGVVAALLTAGLALTLAAPGPSYAAAPASSPAGRGAGWLARQLHHGLVYNAQYKIDDYGLTADTVLGLLAIGGHPQAVATARAALARHVADYTTGSTASGDPTGIYAGPTAKLLVVAQQTGGGGRSFGGTDLVHQLSQRVATQAPIAGRIEDQSAYGDYANTIGQVFAVRGLLRAGAPKAQAALTFLLAQQCASGYFRLNLTADKTAAQQGCGAGDPADSDVTALAVVELASLTQGHTHLRHALSLATAWLKGHQHANGSFGGGPSTSAPNANSTGVAGWALLTEHKCRAARRAAVWLTGLQVAGKAHTPLAHERGAIAYDVAALRAARAKGITTATRDQWRRAGAQAAPALLALSRCRA